ncbi:MAG: hypothetical protein CMH22_05725 [Methylophaga sp.]|nr:hypothetical protein [Methylophaga sp.]|tara:strand:+ start:94294 stop:94485 length:192 start_codon:yes stop_codon:yes gene_type:complete
MSKKEDLEELLQQARDLTTDYSYITYKAPKVLEQLLGVKRVPKELRDEYDDAIRELDYITDIL